MKKSGQKQGFLWPFAGGKRRACIFAGNVMGLPSKESLVHYQQQIRDWSKENLHLFEGWGEGRDNLPEGGSAAGIWHLPGICIIMEMSSFG